MGAARLAAVATLHTEPALLARISMMHTNHAQQIAELTAKTKAEIADLKGQLARLRIEQAHYVAELKEQFGNDYFNLEQKLIRTQQELARAQQEIKDLRSSNEGYVRKLQSYEGVSQFIANIAAASRGAP